MVMNRNVLRSHGKLAAVSRALILLDGAGGVVKTAVVMQRRGLARADAETLLLGVGGALRAALERAP